MLFLRLAKNILIYFKYRKVKFQRLGSNVNLKSLKSNFHYSKNISIGNNVFIGPGADLDGAGGIVIGNGVVFAPGVIIYSRTHYFDGTELEALPFDNKIIVSPVFIEDYVWVGRDVVILPGVVIGEGAVVGARTVVTKDVPKGAVVVGNPAKIVKYRDEARYEDLKRTNTFVYSKFGHKKKFIKNDI